ncbi:ABC transporter permease [Halorussus sp. MSC15.2]|uniref:ABC transporter permease n=1 Tax=Halorussus sp. MSC15.2 TaxID=2283638 RepID=UPI0013D3790A|nr:ABC transporter permease [Halorussus sp. MSC15.2]NEU58815.1 ABC transporter permease [Halorussus sp. MSC15.2]
MMDWLFERFPLAMLARRNLARAKTRSALAMLGVVIGVVAIASLGVFGVAFKLSFLQGATFGNTVLVVPGEDADRVLTQSQVSKVKSYVDGDDDVYALKQRRGTLTHLRQSGSVSVYGVEGARTRLSPERGTIPDTWRKQVLVGAETADTYDVGPGDSVTLDGESYRIAAVLEDQPRGGAFQSLDDGVLVPMSTFAGDNYTQVQIRADSPTEANQTAVMLRNRLGFGREDRYRIIDFKDSIERFNQQMSTINLFLLGVGGISLLVAGISILNVQLMSVIERREEIGVLRAVGYGRYDILRLMLGESALLGLVGALVGAVLSVALGLLINLQLLGDPFAFTAKGFWYIGLGFAFGVGAAVISGLYPAWKAANERPVEALRD